MYFIHNDIYYTVTLHNHEVQATYQININPQFISTIHISALIIQMSLIAIHNLVLRIHNLA